MSIQASIARDIRVRVRDEYGRGDVQAEPAPTHVDSVELFVGKVFAGRNVEHLGRNEMVRVTSRLNPSSLFFQAVHACFERHYPLALRPEVLMYLIMHEIAECVKQNPDTYRALFTTSPDKETIEVRHDGLVRGSSKSPWHEVFPMFNGALRERVPAGIMDHMLPGFSTATPESDAASMVAFMDAASPFYDFVVYTRCGIPHIRLLGDPSDYRKILNAASALSEVFSAHLSRYFDHLLPVLKTLAEQAEGASLDEEFWRSIYKFKSASGTDSFNGWLATFVHYVRGSGGQTEPRSAQHLDWRRDGGWGSPGIEMGQLPTHVSGVPFIWDYFGTELNMSFIGGVLGVDLTDGYVTPSLSYGVLHAE